MLVVGILHRRNCLHGGTDAFYSSNKSWFGDAIELRFVCVELASV